MRPNTSKAARWQTLFRRTARNRVAPRGSARRGIFSRDHFTPLSWISLDSLVRIVTFQWVMGDLRRRKFLEPYDPERRARPAPLADWVASIVQTSGEDPMTGSLSEFGFSAINRCCVGQAHICSARQATEGRPRCLVGLNLRASTAQLPIVRLAAHDRKFRRWTVENVKLLSAARQRRQNPLCSWFARISANPMRIRKSKSGPGMPPSLQQTYTFCLRRPRPDTLPHSSGKPPRWSHRKSLSPRIASYCLTNSRHPPPGRCYRERRSHTSQSRWRSTLS